MIGKIILMHLYLEYLSKNEYIIINNNKHAYFFSNPNFTKLFIKITIPKMTL